MNRHTHLWFVGPALFLMAVILILPILLAIGLSLTDYSLGNTGAGFVEDLGSTNGTYWGPPGAAETDLQKLTQRKLLTAGDTIWIGGEKLTVSFDSAPGGAPQGG